MKKNIVFVIPSLSAGGAEKSLVNLLNTINYNLYQVDLILLNPTGIFCKLVPEPVKIVALNEDYQIFTQNIIDSVLGFLKKGKLNLALARVLYSYTLATTSNVGFAEQYSWKYLRKAIQKNEKNYDAAIGFLEKSANYFVVDCLHSNNKIGFIHNDYAQLQVDAVFDLAYFEKLDTIVTVSDQCVLGLQKIFPTLKEKFKIIYNIVSPTLIHQMAQDPLVLDDSKPILLSIGRLHPQKGFDIAIEAATSIRKKGIAFTWYIIGEGQERPALEQLIVDHNLQQHFILLGLQENPYPYIKKATIVVQPSRYEGKSIAIDEAKILHKPILLTNFSTAKDQISHLQTGIIAEMDATSLATALENLLHNTVLQQQLALNLSEENLGTETEINKLYQIINGC